MAQKHRNLDADVLPERFQYRDDGCEIAPSCLRCPLPQCKYDIPGWRTMTQRLARNARDAEIVLAHRAERLPVDALAARFGVSKRTVFRILSTAGRTGADRGQRVGGSIC